MACVTHLLVANCGRVPAADPGCNFMMCGTQTHGNLRDAIRNGGCGYSFRWHNGQPSSTFFTNLQGKKVTGNPALMYPNEIKQLRQEYGIAIS